MMQLPPGVHTSADKVHGTFKEARTNKCILAWEKQVTFLDVSSPTASLIVSFFALICFVDSIHGDFVFDDSEAIVNNNDIRWEAPISSVFGHDFWGTRLTHPSSHKSYRPLTVLSFKLNHLISGFSPQSYHVANIILHCMVSVACLHALIPLLRGSRQCALLATLLFTTHPIHTEAVAGIVGRADLLCALFVFCALLAYIRAIGVDQHLQQQTAPAAAVNGFDAGGHASSSRKNRGGGLISHNNQHNNNNTYHTSSSSLSHVFPFNDSSQLHSRCGCGKWLAACAFFTTIAMLCKEVGITALGLCSAYELLVTTCGQPGGGLLCLVPGTQHRSHCNRKNYGCVVQRHAILLVVGCGLLLGRWLIMGSAVPRFMHVDNPASFMDSLFFRVLNYQYIYLLNCVLLLLPVWLCFDWSMGCVPLVESLADWRAAAVPLLWLLLALLLRRGFKGRDTGRCVLVSLSLAVVPFLPATNVLFRVGFVIAERVLYLPVAGLCCLVVLGMREAVRHGWMSKRTVLLLYSALLCMFVLRCRQRTLDWATEQRLFRTGLQVCPLNAKVHYNLGKVAGDAGDQAEAVARYREAIRLNPHYDQAMNNLANILKDEGMLPEALELLQTATLLRPDFAAAWMNLGIVQASLGQLERAHHSYVTALHHRPVYPDCLYNLGNLYLERGLSEQALGAWRNATALKPSLSRAWINTLILLDSRQQYEQAVETAHAALRHLPDEASIHFNLANTLGKLSRYTDSETHFRLATQLDPSNANYWSNLGVLYHRWKKYRDAEATYKHTLKLNPKLKSAQDNLNMLQPLLLKGSRGGR